jgi:hypothetical protein
MMKVSKVFNIENNIEETKFGTSLSGLDIPLLTITDPRI